MTKKGKNQRAKNMRIKFWILIPSYFHYLGVCYKSILMSFISLENI